MRKIALLSAALFAALVWTQDFARADPAFEAWVQELEDTKDALSEKIGDLKVEHKPTLCAHQVNEQMQTACAFAYDALAARYRAHLAELDTMIKAVRLDPKKRALFLVIFSPEKYNRDELETTTRVHALMEFFAVGQKGAALEKKK